MSDGIALHKLEAQEAVRDDDGELIEETRVDNEDLESIAERDAGGEASSRAIRGLNPVVRESDESRFEGGIS